MEQDPAPESPTPSAPARWQQKRRPRAKPTHHAYCHVTLEPSLLARLKQLTQRPTAREALEWALADYIMRHWEDPPAEPPSDPRGGVDATPEAPSPPDP